MTSTRTVSPARSNRRRREPLPPVRLPLMDVEPELLERVPAADRAAAQRLPLVNRFVLPPGELIPEELVTGSRPPFGLLVLAGAVCRHTALGRHSSAHLFGPGAIIRALDHGDASLPWTTSWSCIIESEVAVLDHEFPVVLARWPELSEHVQSQLLRELEGSLDQCAWTGLSRVDDRILALFWHLADGWGRVVPDGIAIPLPLTHRLIGRLVAAERATISLALSRLSARGLLARTGTGTWLLNRDSQQVLTDA